MIQARSVHLFTRVRRHAHKHPWPFTVCMIIVTTPVSKAHTNIHQKHVYLSSWLLPYWPSFFFKLPTLAPVPPCTALPPFPASLSHLKHFICNIWYNRRGWGIDLYIPLILLNKRWISKNPPKTQNSSHPVFFFVYVPETKKKSKVACEYTFCAHCTF